MLARQNSDAIIAVEKISKSGKIKKTMKKEMAVI
jgi:hypothetical protein